MNLFQLRDAVFKRDYGNPYLSSRGAQAMAVSVIFTALASCFVGMRMYTRIKLIRRVEASDWVVIIALVSRFADMRILNAITD
jgi:hypothetical protein